MYDCTFIRNNFNIYKEGDNIKLKIKRRWILNS